MPESGEKTKAGTSEVRAVTAVRGIAALAVACFHLTNMDYQLGTVMQRIGSGGWLGVEAFFVISGFVIPFSLLVAHYHRARFGMFLLRRVARVDPPYLLSIVLSISIAFAAYHVPIYRGPRPEFSAGQVLAHIGYVSNFTSYQSINRVYWTLGIEFQYYILIGFFFGALTQRSWPVFGAVLAGGLAINALIPILGLSIDQQNVISHWTPLFPMGISVASFKWKIISRRSLVLRLAVCSVVAGVSASVPIAAVGTVTALFIAFLPGASLPVLDWLGKISYSLYLVHVPVGERLMSLTHRYFSSLLFCFAVSLSLTLAAAVGFNALIEEPARRWARKIPLVTSTYPDKSNLSRAPG